MKKREKIKILLNCFRKLEENRKDNIRELACKLTVALIVVFVSISCVTAEPRNVVVGKGESSPLLSGTSWEYSEESTVNTVYYVKFNKDGKATWHDMDDNIIHHLTAESTWERQGNIIRIPHNSGFRHIEGSLITGTNPRKITGSGKTRHNNEWNFTMIER
jgi:hypothetical protein